MAVAVKTCTGHLLIPVGPSAVSQSSTSSFTCCSTSSSSSPSSSSASFPNFLLDSEATTQRSSGQVCGRNSPSFRLVGRARRACYFGRRGRLVAPFPRREVYNEFLRGVGLYSSQVKGDASQESGSKRNDTPEGPEVPFQLGGGWKEEITIRVDGLLVLGIEHHARLVEGIKNVILKDRDWVEDPLFWGPKKDVGSIVSEDACSRRMLAAVPGIIGLNLSGPQSVLEALGVLAAIVTVHEAGHFLAARLQNIHVTKFAVGFGPTLAKYQEKGVEYSLRAFPFGGFVAFPDDDPNSEFSPDDPNLLKNRPLLDRALVISAGVVANIIFAYSVLFVQSLGVGLLERELFPGVMVPEVISKSAAANAGMRVGDVVLAVDDYQLTAQDSAVFQLVDTIKRSAGRPITLFVQRGEDVLGVEVTPDENWDGSGRIGVQLSPNAKPRRVKAENLLAAAVKSGQEFGRLTAIVLDGLKQIFFNFEKTVDSVSGPVAIVAVGAEVARSDVSGLYQFAAIVNINLAIVNLLPLPALDGGYLAFVILEAVRGGKKLPDGVEQGIMSSGVLLLLALGIVLMVRDTLNLGFVQQML